MTISGIFESFGPTIGTGIGITVLAWILGKFTNSEWYQKLRAKAGRQAYRMGELCSTIGNGKLGAAITEPIEDIAADWCQFMPEQFFAGLRSDNKKKLEKHLDLLEDVGSITRAKGIAEKIEAIESEPADKQAGQDHEMFGKAFGLRGKR